MEDLTNGFATAETATRRTLEQQYNDYVNTYNEMYEAVKGGNTSITAEELEAARNRRDRAKEELDKCPEDARVAAKETGQQWAAGVTSTLPSATAAGSKVASATKDSMTADSYTAGANMGDGFVSGLTSRISSVKIAAANFAKSGLASYEKAADINSPSKEAAKLGSFTGEGYVEGLQEQEESVVQASADIAQSALSALNGETMSVSLKPDTESLESRLTMEADSQIGNLVAAFQAYAARPMEMYIGSRLVGEAISSDMDEISGMRSTLYERGLAVE
jgi:hypothetical protein